MPDSTMQPDNTWSDELWERFTEPRDEDRPRAWWHWMDGNIDPAGIVRDLTWLHSVGVRGVQMFEGGMGMPQVVPELVRPGSDAWDEAVRTAADTSNRLGLELAVTTSSGWSAAGGPWVEPADAIKKVVWSETVVEGGPVDIALPALPAVAGLYQDAPRWGAAPREPWSIDWRVVAFPDDPTFDPLVPDRVTASGPLEGASALTDGSFAETISLPRDPEGWSTAWLAQEFAQAVTVSSVTLGLPGARGFGAAPLPDAVLEVSDDGIRYREVAPLSATSLPARTASFAPVTGRWFRVTLSGSSAADALPPTADGVRRPPVLRTADAFLVSEFALRTAALVHHRETKAGFGAERDYYAVDTDSHANQGTVRSAEVIDVTAHVRDGRLAWDAPVGRWRILRLGASLTGHTNGPAPADATGLEVDKLDGRRVRAYLDRYLERFDATEGISALLSDSIESGPQNWSDEIAERFSSLRGYDPTRWLPTLAGYLVDDPSASDRFLYDYRRTLAEVFAAEFYGTLSEQAHARGLTYYAEALEDRRPQLGDDLAMRSHADVPMGAMWTFDPASGPMPTYVADLKGASSVTHVYGKARTGSEAFSCFDQPWASVPARLKHVADLQLSLGVTRFCIHTSAHQPLATPPPGLALAPFLGQAFTAHEVWKDFAGPWIDYLARCSAILSSGEPAVDIAVFVGEEAPVTGLFGEAFDESVPEGFDFDYVGADALHEIIRVESDTLVSHGARYRLLYLGGSSDRMTVPTLRRIAALLDEGATVVGTRPSSSPSHADDPAEFEALCDHIWTVTRENGRVVARSSLDDALATLSIRPTRVVHGARLRRIDRLIHGRRVSFLANPGGDPVRVRLETAEENLVSWNPVTLETLPLEHGKLELPAFGSTFVLPSSDARRAESREESSIPLEGGWTLELPGAQSQHLGTRPRLWTEGDVTARGFSGTAVYRTEFEADRTAVRTVLDLGEVRDIARVFVNDIDCGVTWTPPFRVDVTSALRAGTNTLRIEIANTWRNRLIAEASAPSGEIFAPMTQVFRPDAAPLPAGLAGPITLHGIEIGDQKG